MSIFSWAFIAFVRDRGHPFDIGLGDPVLDLEGQEIARGASRWITDPSGAEFMRGSVAISTRDGRKQRVARV